MIPWKSAWNQVQNPCRIPDFVMRNSKGRVISSRSVTWTVLMSSSSSLASVARQSSRLNVKLWLGFWRNSSKAKDLQVVKMSVKYFQFRLFTNDNYWACLLYTSDAADDDHGVDLYTLEFINNTGMCNKSIKYAMRQPFSALHCKIWTNIAMPLPTEEVRVEAGTFCMNTDRTTSWTRWKYLHISYFLG